MFVILEAETMYKIHFLYQQETFFIWVIGFVPSIREKVYDFG